jgi:hypothetical protein
MTLTEKHFAPPSNRGGYSETGSEMPSSLMATLMLPSSIKRPAPNPQRVSWKRVSQAIYEHNIDT